MARRARKKEEDVEAYRHETDTRKNVVSVGLASYDTSTPKPKKYEYEHHLDPQLVWTGKAENTFFEVPTVFISISSKISPKKNLDKRFCFFLCKTIEPILRDHTIGMGIPHVNTNMLKNIVCPLPAKSEQTQIATFLDQKTTKIDELIKKNERLIELLREKRQAIISHAVTKGLDPNAKMKDSGIEWTGEIPEEWRVKKIKYVAEIVLGKMFQNDDSGKDEFKPYMRAQNIQWETVDINDVKEMWFSDYEIKKYRLQKGDLLISEGGEVGRTALWNGELEECYIQNSVHKVTVDKKLANNKYLSYLLETYGKWGYFESIVNRVSIGHLTREKLKENEIICPPKNEQSQIVTYLAGTHPSACQCTLTRISSLTQRI